MVPQLSFIFVPLLAASILVAIYVYLGQHVLKRGVIFVDIAIAQIAALGLTFAYYLGYSPESTGAYLYSLIFSLGAAMVFAFAKPKEEIIPQEAIIGICYVVASGLAILLVDMAKDPHGAETIQHLLVGSITWVTWKDIGKMSLVIFPLGLFHILFFPKFYMVTFEPEKAKEERIWTSLWDFLFYFTFGIIVTSSVHICGVLLVFTFLVIPSVCVSLFIQDFKKRLVLSWVLGILLTALGLIFSWTRPSGPTIVFFFGAALALSGMIKYLISAPHKGKAILNLLLGMGIFVGFNFIISIFWPAKGKKHHHHEIHVQHGEDHHNHQENSHKKEGKIVLWQKINQKLLGGDPDLDLKKIQDMLHPLSAKERSLLWQYWKKKMVNKTKPLSMEEAFLAAKIALVLKKKKDGALLLLKIIESEEAFPMQKSDALDLLISEGAPKVDLDMEGSPKENKKALKKL
ncbi:MAG: metal ABC transporter permease, partial [Planctomycetota bacterium]